MRIAVMGAGAVGCYYGGMLSRAGHQVMLIGRTRLLRPKSGQSIANAQRYLANEYGVPRYRQTDIVPYFLV